MLRKILLIYTFLFTTTLLYSQNTVGVLTNESGSLESYTLFSPRTQELPRYTYLIDNCGEVVNKWNSTLPLFSTDYLMPDGSLYRSVIDNQSTLSIPGNTGRIEHLDWDDNTIWALTFSETNFSFHHDYVVLDNGNILMLVAFFHSEAEALAEGRDPSTLANGELYEERVIEIQPVGVDGFNIVWEWHSWDHLIQDFDNTKNNFGVVGDNPQLVDINFGTSFGEGDWWHSNSLSYSPELDQIIISNRNLNEFIIIDHSTTTQEAATNSGGNSNMGGDILYRWGNPESYQQGDSNDRVLFGQHDVQFIQDGLPNAGKIMIFNNGNGLDFTRIQIITAPFDDNTNTYTYTGGAYGPLTVDYEYTDPADPTNFHASFLSGSQQLPNGNILICNGPNGELFEVDTNGNTVWRYQSPVGLLGILSDGEDASASQTRVFRALKYPLDYSAFIDKDLTPQGPIELNPFEDNCTLLSIDDHNLTSIKVYPTITNDIINIDIDQNNFNIALYSINGNLISKHKNKAILNIENLSKGLYFLQISMNNTIQNFKILKN